MARNVNPSVPSMVFLCIYVSLDWVMLVVERFFI